MSSTAGRQTDLRTATQGGAFIIYDRGNGQAWISSEKVAGVEENR